MEFPVKVLILDTVMDRGGAEAMTMNYLRNMDRNKVQFDFLVHRNYKAAYEDEIAELGGKIYRICPPYPQNWFKYQRMIKELLKKHPEYQIIHCNMMELGYPAYKAAKKCGVLIRICHAHIAADKEKITVKSLIRSCYKKMMRSSITHKFACGKEAAEWVFGKDNIQDVIYMKNAIDANQYRYKADVEKQIREEFHLGERFVVGHVGRFFEQKNHPFIIELFAEVVKKEPDAVLMLVGGGELDDAIMNQTKQRVHVLGLDNNVIFTGVRTDVHRIIQAFDVFILPSLCEGFPVVMVEAQASGLKCLISDRVPPECDITGNVEIVSLDSGVRNWAEHILAYKNNYVKQDMYQKIVDAGYDIKANAKWLQEFYIETLSKATSKD
jgi:glycosyltransferase involved in cell wall biosynthesis